MRICLLHPFVWPEVRRGGERYLDDLARYLRSRGHEVDVVVGTQDRDRHDPGAPGLTVLGHLRFPGRDTLDLTDVETFGLRALPTLVRRRNLDLVHALTPSGALAAILARHPTVFSLLGQPSLEGAGGRRRRLLEAAVRRADAVSVLSDTAADALAAAFGRRADVVPPGVVLDRFPPSLDPRSGPPAILFSSALDRPQKGLDVLVSSFASVLATHPDARLWLSGPGDPARALAGADPSVLDRIDVLGVGSPDEVPGRYARAHVTVLPSRNEAFGLVLAESLACGTPVVGTVGGGAESIIEGDVGRLVPHGEVATLAAAIRECIALATDPRTPHRCRARALSWGWDEAVGPRHEELYAKLTQPGRTQGASL